MSESKFLKNVGETFKSLCAALSDSAESIQAIIAKAQSNDGMIRVDNVAQAIESGVIIAQGPRAKAFVTDNDLPESMFFAPIAKAVKEVKDSKGRSTSQVNHGPAQFAHSEYGANVNYSPVMPSVNLYKATGLAYARKYTPKHGDSRGLSVVDDKGNAKQFTGEKYAHLVPLQADIFKALASLRKSGAQAFTMADIMAQGPLKAHEKADFSGHCVRDTLHDLRQFGFLFGAYVANKSTNSVATLYTFNESQWALYQGKKSQAIKEDSPIE